MAFKLRSQDDPVKTGTSNISVSESTAAGRVALMTAAKNIPDKKVEKQITPNLQEVQSKVNLNTQGGGDIGFNAGKKVSFGAGVNINPDVEGLRANIGYKNNIGASISKSKMGTAISGNASFKGLDINATSASGENGYKSIGARFNKGSFSGGLNYTSSNQGDNNLSGGLSFNKGNFGANVSGNISGDNAKVSVGGMLRKGRTTFNANTNLTPSHRTSISGGITYNF